VIDGAVIRRDEPLSRHLPWRTGGPCSAYILVHRRGALAEVLAMLRTEDLAWHVLGAGTRTCARDQGLAGAMIRLGTGFATVARDGDALEVGAAVPVPALCAIAAGYSLAGLERHAGTPGSVGAALANDAWDEAVERVDYVSRGEKSGTLDDLRRSPKAIVVGARLRLRPDRAERVVERTAIAAATMGSPWFCAPKKASSREVLERAGLADVRLRDVALSAVAPEWPANLGGATARDLHMLHQSALDRVVRHTGIELRSRVGWLGRAGV
jgi:UDP-N-acetylmuramate dehydrogenase